MIISRKNPTDQDKIEVPGEHYFYIPRELREKCTCEICKQSIKNEDQNNQEKSP